MEEVAEPSSGSTSDEQLVVNHFKNNHLYLSVGRYQVSLPKKADPPLLGESRSQAVRRFLANERSIFRKGSWKAFQDVVKEYITLNHAEPMPASDLRSHQKPCTIYPCTRSSRTVTPQPNCMSFSMHQPRVVLVTRLMTLYMWDLHCILTYLKYSFVLGPTQLLCLQMSLNCIGKWNYRVQD